MPRGKVITEPAAAKAKAGKSDVAADEVNENKNASKFKLVEAESEAGKETDEEDTGSFHESFTEKSEHAPMNFKFTLLLVAVFVAVNIGLIALLDKDRPEDSTPVSKHENVAVKNEGKSVKENTSNANNVPIKTVETKPVLNEKTQPQTQVMEPEKPVLAAPVPEETVAEKPVAAKPIAAKPAPVKPQSAHPAATQDLLSIISKD